MTDDEQKTAPTEDSVDKQEEVKEEMKEETQEEVKTEETPATDASSNDDASDAVEVPAKFKALVEQVESMSVLELHELVKLLEKKFGVSAVAAVASSATGGDAGGAEEKSEFTVHLVETGAQKIAVIKVIKELLGLGLKEAKELVDGAPNDIKAGVKTAEAEEMKAKLEEAGAKVELK